jgi:glycosyltransferase involved in cell wall biosynthesis
MALLFPSVNPPEPIYMNEFSAQRPLRIAIDLTPLLPEGQNGGVKHFIFEYIMWIGRQRRVPVQFVFLTRKSSHADVRSLARGHDELICLLDDASGDLPGTRDNSPREWACYDAPPNLVANLGADVLYCPFSMCTWSYPGVPVLATIVDVLHRDYPFTLTSTEIDDRERLFQETIRVADCIQCISQYTISRVTHHYGFPGDHMFCTPIAIHNRLLTGPPAQARSPAVRPYFLYPANAWKHKNHEVLLLAYGIYRSKVETEAWDLILTGHDDAAMQSLKKLAVRLGLGTNVRFFGYLSNHDYPTVWREAGALVFPSLHEGFGIPLVEAMAFGLPVISSQIGPLPEVGGDACIYVDATKPLDLAEAMGRIAGNTALRDKLRQQGYKQLESFSFERDALHFLDKLVDCACKPARQTRKGFYPDGWTAPQAAVSTPNWSRAARLEFELQPMPSVRQIRVYHGADLIGSAKIPKGAAKRLQFPFWPDTRALTLRVPDASALSKTDHRICGVRFCSLRLRDDEGAEIDLLTP